MQLSRNSVPLGHSVDGPVTGHARALFGRGHVITKRRMVVAVTARHL